MPKNPNAEIEVTALAWVVPRARGYVRDIRVRWALEEAGLDYRVRLVGGTDMATISVRPEGYPLEQPFGQVPVFKEGALCLFESGAIVMHIAARDERLLPRTEPAHSRAICWMFAALNSIEPLIVPRFILDVLCGDAPWLPEARAAVTPLLAQRLARLAAALGERDWLDDAFSIGDLMMVESLRSLPDDSLLKAHPNLSAYVARGIARPAFQRAMAAQLEDFLSDHAA